MRFDSSYHYRNFNELTQKNNFHSEFFKFKSQLFILIFLLGIIFTGMGQTANNYTFSTGTGASLEDFSSGGTSLQTFCTDDGTSSIANIGFNFVFEGSTFTQFSTSSNGVINLTNSSASSATSSASNSAFGGSSGPTASICGLWDDFWLNYASSTSNDGKIQYKVTGSSPNRILKIDFKCRKYSSTEITDNWWCGSGSSYHSYTIQFQVWLYETSGQIDMIFGSGPSLVSASCGIVGATSTNFLCVNTSSHSSNNSLLSNGNTAWPGSGRYYRFSGCSNPTISSVTSSNPTTCGGSSGQIVVNTSGTVTDYSKDNGSTWTASSNNSYTFNSLSSGTYNIKVRNTASCVATYASNSVTLSDPANPNPPSAISAGSSTCEGTGVTFTQGSCTSGSTCYWVSSASGTETTNSNLNYTSSTSAGTYNVWVRAKNNTTGCWSSSVTASGTVNSLSSAPSSITGNTTVLSGSSNTYTVVGGTLGSGASWKWYTGSCGGSAVATGTNFTTTISGNTTIYVRAEGTCNNSSCASISITVQETCGAIFVDGLNGNDVNLGLSSSPVKSLNRALQLYSESRNHIKMTNGSYTETSIINLQSSVIIEGRYTNTSGNWSKSSSTGSSTSITFSGTESISADVEHIIGLRADNDDNWKLIDLNITTSAASGQTSSGNGKSNYGLYIANGSTGYEIIRCSISSGNASNGTNGSNGNPGTNGSVGSRGGDGGCSCSDDNGGGGANGGANGAGGSGGPGGDGGPGGTGGYGGGGGSDYGTTTSNTTVNQTRGNRSGYRGQTGFNGCPSGSAANSCGSASNIGGDGGTGSSGQDGSTGGSNTTSGSNGVAGTTVAVSYTNGYYVPSYGNHGGGGSGGSGGSGGGGGAYDDYLCDAAGDGGNGGSGGGGGGEGGSGARGGGSSFAIFLTNTTSSGNIYNTTLSSGTAGPATTGGNGGAGGTSPSGESGYNNCDWEGWSGIGGQGGAGGAGGKGGDANAGLSNQMYVVGVGGTSPSSSVSNGTIISLINTPNRICQNSTLQIQTSAASWSLPSGWEFTKYNNASTASQYSTGSTSAEITTSNTSGSYNLTANNVAFNSYLTVNSARTLPSITLSNSTVCVGGTVDLSASSWGTETDYIWEIYTGVNADNNGTTTNRIHNVTTSSTSYTFNTPGTYTVRYRVKESCCGWSKPVFATITVSAIPNAGTLSGIQAVCSNGTTTFTSNGDAGGTWSSGSTGVATINSSTGVISPVAAGTSTITYSVTGTGGCSSASATRTVTVTTAPNAGTLSGTQTVCSNGTTTFTSNGDAGGAWSSGSTGVATINSSTGVISPVTAGTSTITYTITGTGGCSNASANRTVTVNALPNVNISGSSTICISESTNLLASGATSYVWDNGSTSTSRLVTPTSSSNYSVTGTDANNCSNIATINVTVNQPSIPYSIAGKEYYIWRGTSSSDYQTASNWYYKGTNDGWSISSSVPTTGNDVLIASGTCVINPPVISSTSSSADSVIILSDANLTITGSNTRFTVENDLIARTGSSLTLASEGILEVRGGSLKFNTGSTFTPNNGTVEMHYKSGHIDAHVIECADAGNNTFYNLNFHGDQIQAGDTAVALSSNITVTNELKVVSANLRLNGKTLTLGTNAKLVEGSNGKKVFDYGADGKIVTTRTIGDGGTSDFGGLGLTITLPSGKSMGSTTVERFTRKNAMISVPGNEGLDLNGNQPIERFFRVTPTINGTVGSPLNATVVFNFKTAGLNSYNSGDISMFAMYRRASGDTGWQKLNGSINTSDKTMTVPNFPRFSDVTLGGGGEPLPVELLSFSGICEDGVIDLTWETASESNSSHFDVEKSRDGESWQLLTTVPSAGNSNELITYQTADKNVSDGNNYFRLRQVDIDGAEKLYNPINVSCSEVTTGYFSSFPNPSGNSFQVVIINEELIGPCVLNIVDALGKLVEHKQIEVKDGINMFVNNQELNPGIYFINITNGSKSTTVLRHAIK